MEQEYKEIICALKHSEIPLDIQKKKKNTYPISG